MKPDPVRQASIVLLSLLLCTGGVAAADDVQVEPAAELRGPWVGGYERFFRPVPQRSERETWQAGMLLLGDFNCVACHAPPPAAVRLIAPKSGPVLTEATARLKPGFIRGLLSEPQAAKAGTTMPDLLHGLEADDRSEQIENLVHYLTSLGGHPEPQLPTMGAGQRGEQLFHQIGCVACHGPQREGALQPGDVRAPGDSDEGDGEPDLEVGDVEFAGNEGSGEVFMTPLGDLPAKYTLPGLTRFLLDPLHIRRDGRMPSLSLSPQEATDIAAYLLKLPEVARLRYDYYEGNWDRLPDFSQLTPVASGGAEDFTVDVARRRDRFALRFQGYLRIERAGRYQFHLGSDDGSRLWLDGDVLIDHDGIHAFSQQSARVRLEPGSYPVVVEYFEQAGEESLLVEYQGPGLERQPLGRAMTAEREVPSVDDADLRLELDQVRVAAGRQAFRILGCAACHLVEETGTPVRSVLSSRPLSELDPQRGCLAVEPPREVPDYALRDDQREVLRRVLRAWHEDGQAESPDEALDRSLVTFQCYACHQRQGRGGVVGPWRDLFVTTMPEMGDEGRLPMPLTGVGAKLKPAWLAKVLEEGSKVRPYMLARMPRFGAANVGHLPAAFAAADPVPEATELLPYDQPWAEVKEIGRKLVGEQGASCIKCHTFGEFASQGIQAMDLRTMAERLRAEWFHPYLRNPQSFRPGTRMPSAWPLTGKSFFDEYFDGDSDRQVGAVWEYLQDGERARIPAGLVTPAMELVPVDEAIIYRNFIEGAGPRAIAVGYPEGVHQAFDANQMRMALLWQGRFIDASRHWSGRGQGFQPPAGDHVLALPPGPVFARLSDPLQSWPDEQARPAGFRFLGYQLTSDQRPAFRYRYEEVEFEEFLDTRNLQPGSAVPRRQVLRAREAPRDLWMRVAVGRQIEAMEEGWYRVDDHWQVRPRHAGKTRPILREQPQGRELLLQVEFTDGRAEIVTEFLWPVK